MINTIPNRPKTLLDKGFWGADLLLSVSNNHSDRHLLTPAGKGLVYEEIKHYNDHDKLLRVIVSPQARKRNPDLPEKWDVRAVTYEINGTQKTVYTSLPHAQYSTEEVATLYHERWEIELGFRDIKSSMHNSTMTLSKTGIRLTEIRSGIASLCLYQQPRPSRPRAVKMSKTRYPVNKRASPLK